MLWPTRFNRYILSDVIQLFLVMLVGLTSLIMLGLVLQHLISAGLGLTAFTQLLPYASVMSLQFALPAALLFSVCTVFGRISADNELTALKSVGISPLMVVKPVLILALFISPMAVWMIDLAVSWGSPGMQKVVLYSLEETVYRILRTNRSYTSQAGVAIHVQDVEGNWLIKPTITMYGSNSIPQTITAERARIALNPKNESLTIELVNYDSDNGDKWMFDGGQDSIALELPLSKAAQKNNVTVSASMVPLREIGTKKQELERELNLRQSRILTRSSLALATGRLAWLQDNSSDEHRRFVEDGERRMQRLQAEPWRRWAQGFSCFSFVWLGIPLAIQRRSADYIATFGICFLPILLLYYPLFILGVDQAKGGDWHPASPWLANIVLLLIGGWLMRKVSRD
jgi:lipopolysaccharide export system permease protein